MPEEDDEFDQSVQEFLDSEGGQFARQLMELRTTTSQAIEEMARAQLELHRVRANREASSESTYDAARRFRQSEERVKECVQAEVDALCDFLTQMEETGA